jgi:amino acid transporter
MSDNTIEHQSTGGVLKKHKMSTLAAFFMIFTLVAGGYFGMEDMVSMTGPGLTILILIVFPFLWSIPQALIASELGSAIPEEGGYYKWVQRAFGEFWGFQVGWWRTISCYIDSTLYIVLSVSYINAFIPLTEMQNFMVRLAIVLFFVIINLLGLKEVSRITSGLMIFVFATLFIFVALGAVNWQFNPVIPFYATGQGFMQSIGFGVAFCIWVYSGYESMGTMSGEVANPQVIPRATMLTIPVVTLVYILPIIFGLASYGSYELWSVDHGVSFVTMIGSFGIPGLMLIFTLGAVACFFSLYNAYLASASRGFFVIAEDKLSPPMLCKLNKKFGTPHLAIISMGAINLFLSQFGFATLVVINVVLFMFAYLVWFFSAIALRIKEPDLKRPFRIPFGTKGMIIMTIAPAIICMTALFTNGLNYWIGGCLGILTGPLFYVIFKKRYGGLDNKKTMTKGQKKSTLALTAFFVVCLLIGCGLLINENAKANESLDAVHSESLSAHYDHLGVRYVISEDSFALDLADRGNENAETVIWFYYGDLTGDVYLYDEFASEAEFADAAFAIYIQLKDAGLSQIDIYCDNFWFVAYDGDVWSSAQDILAYLLEE